ncbi:MAG: hypothetical protein SNJ77_04600 [Cytophagales bacterium]
MMIKFNINANWPAGKKSIIEVSYDLWDLLKALSQIDDSFLVPTLSKENQKDVSFRTDELSKEEAVKIISSTILNFSEYDIAKYEKEQNPTIEYSRDFGFSFVLTYGQVMSFNIIIGCSSANGLSVLSYNSNNNSFEWYYSVLKAIITGSNATRGAIGIRDLPFQKACRNLAAPLGWITYFSNSFKPEIPNNLEGIEYEFTDKGKYLILTREDFTTDKETYEAHKQKLLNVMEEIKRRVPEYGK